MSELNLDHDEARALHRIVRAMHDGECPKCHTLSDSRRMLQYDTPQVRCSKCGKTSKENKQKYCGDGSDKDNGHRWEPMPLPAHNAVLIAHVCPQCGFRITVEESSAALEEFRPFMERNLEIFEKWRAERKLAQGPTQ